MTTTGAPTLQNFLSIYRPMSRPTSGGKEEIRRPTWMASIHGTGLHISGGGMEGNRWLSLATSRHSTRDWRQGSTRLDKARVKNFRRGVGKRKRMDDTWVSRKDMTEPGGVWLINGGGTGGTYSMIVGGWIRWDEINTAIGPFGLIDWYW